jgi:hypothetical protein
MNTTTPQQLLAQIAAIQHMETGKLSSYVPGGRSADAGPYYKFSCDGTGAPMRKEELVGRKGKQPDGQAKTREVKLGAVFTQHTRDEKGRPIRDHQSTTYQRKAPNGPRTTPILEGSSGPHALWHLPQKRLVHWQWGHRGGMQNRRRQAT